MNLRGSRKETLQTQSLHHQDRVNADISAEAASVQNAVSEVCSATAFLELVDREIVCVQGLKESHDSSAPNSGLQIPGLNKVLGKAVQQVKAAVETKPAAPKVRAASQGRP